MGFWIVLSIMFVGCVYFLWEGHKQIKAHTLANEGKNNDTDK